MDPTVNPTRDERLDKLRERLQADLAPVRPLRSERLCLWLAIAFLLISLLALRAIFGLRTDHEHLGPLWLWGPSILQIALALTALGLAMSESLPGRSPSMGLVAAAITVGLGCHVATTLAVWAESPARGLAAGSVAGGIRDLGMELCLGLPMVVAALWIAQRGVTARTTRMGLTVGFGAALACDGVWRLFCPVSEPSHVFSWHSPALVVVLLVGWALAERWRRRMLQNGGRGASAAALGSGI